MVLASNVIDDIKGIDDLGDEVYLNLGSNFTGTGYVLLLQERYHGTPNVDLFICNSDTLYWLGIERDEAVDFGTLIGRIYDDSERTSLVDTLSVTLQEKVDFRYPVYVGDVIELKGKVSNKSEAVRIIELKLSFWNEKGMKVASGKCQVRCF